MHKAAEEAVTSLHDLSAVDLIAGYRAKQFSPSEVLEEALVHIAAWEPHIKALYLFDPDGAGAGAAGAAGYGPLHLGTAIGGSVRLPACWCGLVGLKPSLGRIPTDPFYVGRVAGPLTRTVDDTALMMSVLSKPDRRDGMSLPPDSIHWKALEKKSQRKLGPGLMPD